MRWCAVNSCFFVCVFIGSNHEILCILFEQKTCSHVKECSCCFICHKNFNDERGRLCLIFLCFIYEDEPLKYNFNISNITFQFHIPIAVTLASRVSVSDVATNVDVRITNLLGADLGALTVIAETARHVGDDAVVLSKQAFTVDAKDKYVHLPYFLARRSII